MTRNLLRGSSAVAIGVMLLIGVVRAQNKAEEREAEVRKLCAAEAANAGGSASGNAGGSAGRGGIVGGLAGRFGLGSSAAAPAGTTPSDTSSTPEITLIPAPSTTAGSVLNLSVKGKFVPGTRFVFENDAVEVIQAKVSANAYEVSLRVNPLAAPAVIQLKAFAPRTCGASALVPVAVVSGKYAWDLTATNGWKVQLRSEGVGLARTPEGKYEETYSAEFYRNSEAKPFQVRKATLSPVGEGVFSFSVSGPTGAVDFGGETLVETQARIMKRMVDPTVSDAEKQKLSQEFSAALENYGKQLDAAVAQNNDRFTCQPGSLQWDGKAAKATLQCSGTALYLTGTMTPVR